MEVVRKIDGRVVNWKYDKLRVLGAYGQLLAPLESIASLSDTLKIEFAEVKRQKGRSFLAGISFNPAIDFTMVQRDYPLDDSIVLYTLNYGKAKNLIDTLVASSRFNLFEPPKHFIENIESEVKLIETVTYEGSEGLSRLTKIPLENLFWSIRYGNFLISYKGIDEESARKKAMKKFKIK